MSASALIALVVHGTGWILVLIACRPYRLHVALIGLLLAGADIAL